MSRTVRTYNKPSFYKRNRMFGYHPYRQYNISKFWLSDYGVTKRGESKSRRLRYLHQMLTDINNL